MAEEFSPLEQFEIKRIVPIHIGGVDVSFTNSALFMCVAVVLVTALMVLTTRQARLVPTRWQSIPELGYEFIAGMIQENAGKEGMAYFPFVFTLFMFVLAGNLIGMVPYTFTYTSHIIVTFGMAIVIFTGVTAIGIRRHGLHFLSLFAPEGVPCRCCCCWCRSR